MINKQQQLNVSHYQYIYAVYYKMLCLKYLQNLPSVISILSSESYTPARNITSKNTEHGNYTYGYDDLDRLTDANYPTLSDETLGNRKTDSNTGITQWLYNQNNQLLNSVNNQFIYDANGSQIEEKDANGQLLKQYIYNTENRLAEIKDANGVIIATYYYDPFGRRLSKTIANPDTSTTTTYFHYNDEGYSAEKTNGQIISYLFSPQNTWSTNPIFKRENNSYYDYQNDHLGTPNILHDKQGQVVYTREMSSFGEWNDSINTINIVFAFAGQYIDNEKKEFYNYFRNYSPKTGRYIQKDPIGFTGGNNIYSYTFNNPLKWSDSKGKINDNGRCTGIPNQYMDACFTHSPPSCGDDEDEECEEDDCDKPFFDCMDDCFSFLNPWWSTTAAGAWGIGTSAGCVLRCANNPCYKY